MVVGNILDISKSYNPVKQTAEYWTKLARKIIVIWTATAVDVLTVKEAVYITM